MKSIIRVQRVFRGSQERIKLYSRLVDNSYTCKSVRFNRRLIGFKMWRLSKKIVDKITKSNEYFTKLLKDME
jgi:hypothetical protein